MQLKLPIPETLIRWPVALFVRYFYDGFIYLLVVLNFTSSIIGHLGTKGERGGSVCFVHVVVCT